jgi:hypothetical protein
MSTQENFLPTCDPGLTPVVAYRSHPFTPRRAVDSCGHVGSFYDACCDQVLHDSNLNFVIKSVKTQRPPECYIKTCTTEQREHL